MPSVVRVVRAASLALLVSSTALAGSAAGPNPIIGGTKTAVGDYPTVVAISVADGLCTGELIAKDWVLTAAHCVDPQVLGVANQAAVTSSVIVIFDSVNVNTGLTGKKIRAKATMFDSGFSINNLGSHDMGLIQLATPVTDRVPSPINLTAANAPIGTQVTQVGFGTTSGSQSAGAGVEYQLLGQTVVKCSSLPQGAGQGLSDANLLCFSQTNGKGKCEGDSGGPSFAMIDGVQTIVGITSFGDQTCATFGADTRVDAEMAFIKANVTFACTTDMDCDAGHECFQQSCIVTPFSPSGLGSTCATAADCESSNCADGDGGLKCSTACTVGQNSTCPSGFDCLDTGATGSNAAGACWPAGAGGGGCCDTDGKGAPTMLLGLALCGVLIRRRTGR